MAAFPKDERKPRKRTERPETSRLSSEEIGATYRYELLVFGHSTIVRALGPLFTRRSGNDRRRWAGDPNSGDEEIYDPMF